jgi:hypothetical protein
VFLLETTPTSEPEVQYFEGVFVVAMNQGKASDKVWQVTPIIWNFKINVL